MSTKKTAALLSLVSEARESVKQNQGMETARVIHTLNVDCENNDPMHLVVWSPQATEDLSKLNTEEAKKIIDFVQNTLTNDNTIEEKKTEFDYYKTNEPLFWIQAEQHWVYADFAQQPKKINVLRVLPQQI